MYAKGHDGFSSWLRNIGLTIEMGLRQVGLGQPPLGLENFLQKSQIFQFFPFRSKKYNWVGSKNTWVNAGSAPYLLRVRSMLVLSQISPSLDNKPWPSQ